MEPNGFDYEAWERPFLVFLFIVGLAVGAIIVARLQNG